MNKSFIKPPLRIQPTTLWEYPSQHYGKGVQGDPNYIGATPSYIIWNLLERYTQANDLIVDPCCGSGTSLDVAKDLGRRAIGYDLNPTRDEIEFVDSRKMPLPDGHVDFVFIDPPYGTHVDYSDDPRCIGKIPAGDEYYDAMDEVIGEMYRILKPGRYMALYVSDSYEKKGLNKGFHPIGFELFASLSKLFTPVDIISVVRHNKTLEMGNYRRAAEEGNFFLRGFNYLFIMQKPGDTPRQTVKTGAIKKQKSVADKAAGKPAEAGAKAVAAPSWKAKYKTVNGKLVRVNGEPATEPRDKLEDKPKEDKAKEDKAKEDKAGNEARETKFKDAEFQDVEPQAKAKIKTAWVKPSAEVSSIQKKEAPEVVNGDEGKTVSKPWDKKQEASDKPSWKKRAVDANRAGGSPAVGDGSSTAENKFNRPDGTKKPYRKKSENRRKNEQRRSSQ